MRLATLLLLAGVGVSAHDTHVSSTRMVIEGSSVVCRIRMFRDDLEKALRTSPGQETLAITTDARADSLVQKYLNQVLQLTADGERLTGSVVGSGLETDDARQEVAWYIVEYPAAHPPARLVILNAILFESFRNQQNIMSVLKSPDDKRFSLYFIATDPEPQTLRL